MRACLSHAVGWCLWAVWGRLACTCCRRTAHGRSRFPTSTVSGDDSCETITLTRRVACRMRTRDVTNLASEAKAPEERPQRSRHRRRCFRIPQRCCVGGLFYGNLLLQARAITIICPADLSPGCRNCRNCRNCRTTVGQLSDNCRTTVGLSDCRTVGQLSDSCRTAVGQLSELSDSFWTVPRSSAVGHCRTLSELSDCRTVGLSDTVGHCRTLRMLDLHKEGADHHRQRHHRRRASSSPRPTADISPFANLPIWAASLPLEKKDAPHHS